MSRRDADEVAGGRVHDPLRLRGRAARVEEVEEVLRVHRLAGTRGRILVLGRDEVVPPLVPPFLHRHVIPRAPENDRLLHAR
ncbi:MAG TPA: hypothetical protein VGQ68_02835 [Gaiellaceae bacterium]|nr:hypothetical protein [Gaiellaceae bacterium]